MKSDLNTQPQGYSYLIVGSGRLATHLSYYFKLLEVPFQNWNRKESSIELKNWLAKKPLVILAISDSALESFYAENLSGQDLTVVHCSGAHVSEKMISCHPLMTFGKNLYSLDVYKKIFFAVTGIEKLQDLFPFLTNGSFKLDSKDKALYHALCVLSAAGAQKIWNQSETILKSLGMPKEAFSPYIKQIAENYMTAGTQALTGPWARGDAKTITQNLHALSKENDSLHKVYEILKEGRL